MNPTEEVAIETSILIEIRRLIKATERYASRLADKHGVTVAQLVVMQELDSTSKISQEELAERLHFSDKSSREILDRLERLELIARTAGRKEPDKIYVSLTDKSNEILDKNPLLLQDTLIEELEDVDDWQKTMLLSSFQRINNLIEAERLEASPILTAGKVTQPEPVTNGKVKQIFRPERKKVRIIRANSLEELERNIDIDTLTAFVGRHMIPFQDSPKYTKKGITDALTGIPADGGFILLAYVDDELVGTLVMLATGMKYYIPKYCLLFVSVNGKYRGFGIGQQIMDYALEEADGNIFLHVDYDNPAKRLYERMGFFNSYAEMRYYKKRIAD